MKKYSFSQIVFLALVLLLPLASLKAADARSEISYQQSAGAQTEQVMQPVYYPGSYVLPDQDFMPGDTEEDAIYKANQHPGI